MNIAKYLRHVILAHVLLVALASPSLAETGWTNVSKVVRLVNTANGGINVLLSPQLVSCTSQSGYGPNYASIYPDHPGINRMKADLLVAMQTGANVQLYLWEGCKAVEMILFSP